MNILVVGGGYQGRNVAEILDRAGHDVAIIEEVEEKISSINPEFGGVIFKQFPMDIANLANAGIAACDAVLVTTSDDNLNIAIGQIAKKHFNIATVVCRISDPDREYVFEKFGLKTVCPTNISSDSMISAISSLYERKNINIGTNTISFSVSPIESRYYGKTLSDVACMQNESAFGVLLKNGRFVINTVFAERLLEEGDSVVYARSVD